MDTFADINHYDHAQRGWVNWAIGRIDAEGARTCETNLRPLQIPGAPQVDVYLKDESTHPTGSLKHRLARSLFLYALCIGSIGPSTTIVEASSGSTAVSEAYFARLSQVTVRCCHAPHNKCCQGRTY
ncbi:MAG: pyridoxal-phosphate dependent enzyme [Antricoccus sp.]